MSALIWFSMVIIVLPYFFFSIGFWISTFIAKREFIPTKREFYTSLACFALIWIIWVIQYLFERILDIKGFSPSGWNNMILEIGLLSITSGVLIQFLWKKGYPTATAVGLLSFILLIVACLIPDVLPV